VLEFRILGPLEVVGPDGPIQLGGPKQRATLAILLLNANRVVSVERLADDLYAGAPPVTAVTQVQRQVSDLRKALGAKTIETRSPGYVLHAEPGRLDLERFEQLTHAAAQALHDGDAQSAADQLRRALELWRGAPLADLTYEAFAQNAIGRLDELRLGARESRFEAELELGRHAQLLGELEALVWDHPLRERLRAQLMLALYRAGRQADALEVYRRTRETLVEQFGIEPSSLLRELERKILAQDPTLDAPSAAAPERTLLVVPSSGERLDALLSVARALGGLPDRTTIVARLVAAGQEVQAAATALAAAASAVGGAVRTAAFTSLEPARDIVRLARNYDVDVVLVDAADEEELHALAGVGEHSPADLAVLSGPGVEWPGGGVFVPFGGTENDWAALELGARLAEAAGTPLRLVGTAADPARGRRDASRLLADASLAVQRVVGVPAEPLLADVSEEALVEAVRPAAVVVCGLPGRWRAEGPGTLRRALLGPDGPPALFVQRGTRPGVLAPGESRTRFSWSLEV